MSEDESILDRSMKSHSTFYDRVYLRNYEPECVRRQKEVKSAHLKNYLELEPYKGNPSEVFKSLLRPRNRSNERHLSMQFIR